MRLIARCVHGAEWIVADEISSAAPGGSATQIELDRREVTFTVTRLEGWVTQLATVDDVFAQAGRFEGVGLVKAALPGLARGIEQLPWARVIDQLRLLREVPDRPQIDVVASLEGRRSYSRFAVEQIVGESLSRLLGGSYLRRTASGREPGDPDLTVRLFLRGDQAIGAVRVLAEPAHRRAYKLSTGPGTLHPPVAAALARIAAPAPGALVLDPFGGDGTIAIELGRAFPQAHIVVRDADPARVENAVANAARAGVGLDVACGDAGSLPLPSVDVIATNPPWNVAVDAAGSLSGSLEPFWQRVPDLLTTGGRLVVLGDDALDVPELLARRGFGIGLVSAVRVAGRVCHIVLAAAPSEEIPELPESARRWRDQAISDGVLTESGF